MLVVGVGVFMDAPPQRVVGVVDAECVVFKAHQTVEQVPAHLALLARFANSKYQSIPAQFLKNGVAVQRLTAPFGPLAISAVPHAVFIPSSATVMPSTE
ncbi:hypothetical protein TU87_22720 [Pseudomonas weihenstephanensis]|nr:hypothetical protein TU87_22720 [Pseudomonas weihenstephanensis]